MAGKDVRKVQHECAEAGNGGACIELDDYFGTDANEGSYFIDGVEETAAVVVEVLEHCHLLVFVCNEDEVVVVILVSTVAWISIAFEYLTKLRSPNTFSRLRPVIKCVFQEGESSIVELSLISMNLLHTARMAIDGLS